MKHCSRRQNIWTDRMSIARPKARPLMPAEYKEAKAAVKQRRRARKNRKRYQKKKLYGPKKDAIES